MGYILTTDGELYHYGIKGQKWGVRRYQNKDGSLTPAGKKRAKQEYKADNKQAFELGKNATITGHAAARSMKRTIHLENALDKRYKKDPEGQKRLTKALHKRWVASAETTAQLTETFIGYKSKAEAHCKSLIAKYGQEAVSSIKYKDVKMPKGEYSPGRFTTVNERTNNAADYTRAGAVSVAASGTMALAMGLPIAVLVRPATTGEKAQRLAESQFAVNYHKQKQK